MHRAGLTTHHTSQGDGLIRIGHQEVVATELPVLTIQQQQGLTGAGSPKRKGLGRWLLKAAAVVGVQGLPGFEHHQIGDVHQVVDAALPGGIKPLLQPRRRRPNRDTAECGE